MVLVAYATKHGSTENVAAEIAAVLAAAGFETQLRPAAEVRDTEGFDGVVLGAPRRALAKHTWLTPVTVALFGGADPPKRNRPAGRDARDWDAIRAWADGLRSALDVA